MSTKAWYKYFFRSLLYIFFGGLTFLMSYGRNTGLSVMGGFVLIAGLILVTVSVASFFKWLIK